jgi:hypothetical protein
VPEASRRGRGFAVYAALRSLGRTGVAELVERCCALARRLAERVAPEVEVLNEVVLNQVLLRFGSDDAVTDAVVDRVQREGTLWAGGTRWHGVAAMRVSVSNWSTTEADIDLAADAILRAAREAARLSGSALREARAGRARSPGRMTSDSTPPERGCPTKHEHHSHNVGHPLRTGLESNETRPPSGHPPHQPPLTFAETAAPPVTTYRRSASSVITAS